MRKKQFNFDLLAVILLLSIFLCTGATLLLFGLQVYKQTTAQAEQSFSVSTPLAYLAGRVRQHSSARVGTLPDGTRTLILESEFAQEQYHTLIYFYDGALYEQFSPIDTCFDAPDGIRLIETLPFTFEQKDNLLTITCQDEMGLNTQFQFSPRINQGEVAS